MVPEYTVIQGCKALTHVLDSKFTKNYLRNAEIHEIEGNHRLSGTAYKKLFEELIRRKN